MLVEAKEDIYKINYLTDRVDSEEQINMREMAKWCRHQGITFKTHFSYGSDYSIIANLWNFYTYCRFCHEERVKHRVKVK